MARADAYLHAEFHLDPFNHLATLHERQRPTGQTDNGLIAYGELFCKRSPTNVVKNKRKNVP